MRSWGLLLMLAGTGLAQERGSWQDPSPHKLHFVAVQAGVKLEVLEWPGTGRPVLLLAGLGNTAHVYDDFALRLAGCHVYAVTRRGFGRSDKPESGYGDQRLADDVLAVIDALKLEAPVVVGHSMAGSELTTLGVQHSDRISGLVYLDAGVDPKDLSRNNSEYRELLGKLPPGRGVRLGQDMRSVAAFQEWQTRSMGYAFPEAELRNLYRLREDGRLEGHPTLQRVAEAIDKGAIKRDYTGIRVPVLSIFATPQPPIAKSEEHRKAAEAVDAMTMKYIQRYEARLQSKVPAARIVEWPGANHYLFLGNEAEVVRELLAFVAKPPGASSFTGVWRAQMDGLPVFTVTFSDEGREMTGAILFYMIRRDEGQPPKAIPGHPEPLFDLKLNGDELSFRVSHRRSHGERTANDPPVAFRVKLTGVGEGALLGGAATGDGIRIVRDK